jgi:hypothetical protein
MLRVDSDAAGVEHSTTQVNRSGGGRDEQDALTRGRLGQRIATGFWDCGGKRSATPLSARAPSSSESAVVAALCRRSP